MPLHRLQNKRNQSLTLDVLLDDYRRGQKLAAGTLDLVLMAYRYHWLFQRELAAFRKDGVKPALMSDLLQLTFAALMSRDRTPESALVSESVEVARKVFGAHTTGVANAFLRGVTRNKSKLKAELLERPEILLGSHLRTRWATTPELVGRVSRALAHRPGAGIEVFDENGERRHLETVEGLNESESPLQAMDAGSWDFMVWMSERVAEKFANLTHPVTHLDACAAPGGKLIAAHVLYKKLGVRTQYFATEARYPRYQRLRDNISRWDKTLGTTTDTRVHAFGEIEDEKNNPPLPKAWPQKFDVILADLPCSGTGTLHSHPDLVLEDLDRRIADLVPLQRQILLDLKTRVAQGGMLIVSICSVDPAEISSITAILGLKPQFSSWSREESSEGITGWLLEA